MDASVTTNEAHGSYWKEILAGFAAPTPLVVDRAPTQAAAGDSGRERSTRKLLIERAATAELEAWLIRNGLGWEALIQGLWGVLLCRYCGEDAVLFGWTDATHQPLPARVMPAWEESSLGWLKALQREHEARKEFLSTPADQIRACAEIPLEVPLFESLLVVASGAAVLAEAPLVVIADPGSELLLRIDFARERFDAAAIERMLGHLATLLAGVLKDPECKPSRLPLLTAAEREQIVEEWNDTAVEFPSDKCLHELFEAQADRDPSAVAVVFGGEQLTYGELDARANQLAHHLRGLGVGPDAPVGISLARGLDMVVGLLGILKAGGGYVPLDPTYPKERLAFLVEDSNVPVLLTQSSLLGLFEGCKSKVVRIDSDAEPIGRHPMSRPDSGVGPEHLSYLIYTSGSTGKPKGVLLDHRGRVSNFCDFNARYSVGPGDRLLALASMSFDMCAYDVFGTLMAGATIVVGETTGNLDPSHWAELMVTHQISVWHSVPALLEILVGYVENHPELHPKSLRLVLLGGDWIPVSLPDRVKAVGAPEIRVISMGGATEVSMDSTIYEIAKTDADWKSIPYGAPMWNQLAYVLDPHLQPVPIGVPGELHLGGIGVGRGYLNRPELTAAKFIANPFREGRIYKTGDLARYRPDGNLELLGRIDFQVKIRGFRIELGEIESSLRQHPAVRECVVVARDDATRGKRLIAYVIRDEDYTPSAHQAQDLNQTQVERWKSVYDSAYDRGTDQVDPTFNIASWDSSYTGEPIGAEQMREWVERTVDRVLALGPKRVLEIGCGTGLLLFRIAPHCEKYWGTDISKVALEHVRKHLGAQGLDQVELHERFADNFDGLQENSFDAVVLNSIVMDFPDPEYLMSVLRGAARIVAPGGFIFVGDVRGLPLLDSFHSSVQLHRAPASWSAEQLRGNVQKQMALEEELVIDPGFFYALPHHIPDIGHVEVQLKRGLHHNELTKTRFNATLHIGVPDKAPAIDAQRLDWRADSLSLESLEQYLRDKQPAELCVEGIPNARTNCDVNMQRILEEADASTTAGDLRGTRAELERSDPGIEPEDLWRLSEKLPYEVDLRYARSGEPERLDCVLIGRGAAGQKTLFPSYVETDPRRPMRSYFNDPMRSAVAKGLEPELRAALGERLPLYMVPSAFAFLDAFPLSPNGKVNRRALPEPDHLRPELEEQYVAPQNPVEQVVAAIWADGLGLDRVGTRDGFVALGGNSLLATQLVSRIRDIFEVDLPLKFCLTLTVGELAQRLDQAGREAGMDVSEIAQIYTQVDSLSESEVSSLLEEPS
jgi:amino acid adenylation domain-containing protein